MTGQLGRPALLAPLSAIFLLLFCAPGCRSKDAPAQLALPAPNPMALGPSTLTTAAWPAAALTFRVHLGQEVPLSALSVVADALPLLRRHGLTVSGHARPERLALGALWRRSVDAMSALPEGEQREALLEPLRTLLAGLATCPAGAVDVVIAADLAPPDSAAAVALPGLTGLALSPLALRSAGLGYWVAVLWPDGAAADRAVIVLSWRRLAALSAAQRAQAFVHEVGHLLGRGHGGGRSSVRPTLAPGGRPARSSRFER